MLAKTDLSDIVSEESINHLSGGSIYLALSRSGILQSSRSAISPPLKRQDT
jgi:hypothetical protein